MDDQHHLNDDGGERGEGGLEQRPLLAIESLDDYVNRFGLPHANGGKLILIHQNMPCIFFHVHVLIAYSILTPFTVVAITHLTW